MFKFKLIFSSAPITIRTQVHYNCHIKTMSYAVKREIKSFQFLLEGSSADFVSDVSRESVPCGRARKRERSLAEFCSLLKEVKR